MTEFRIVYANGKVGGAFKEATKAHQIANQMRRYGGFPPPIGVVGITRRAS